MRAPDDPPRGPVEVLDQRPRGRVQTGVPDGPDVVGRSPPRPRRTARRSAGAQPGRGSRPFRPSAGRSGRAAPPDAAPRPTAHASSGATAAPPAATRRSPGRAPARPSKRCRRSAPPGWPATGATWARRSPPPRRPPMRYRSPPPVSRPWTEAGGRRPEPTRRTTPSSGPRGRPRRRNRRERSRAAAPARSRGTGAVAAGGELGGKREGGRRVGDAGMAVPLVFAVRARDGSARLAYARGARRVFDGSEPSTRLKAGEVVQQHLPVLLVVDAGGLRPCQGGARAASVPSPARPWARASASHAMPRSKPRMPFASQFTRHRRARGARFGAAEHGVNAGICPRPRVLRRTADLLPQETRGVGGVDDEVVLLGRSIRALQ